MSSAEPPSLSSEGPSSDPGKSEMSAREYSYHLTNFRGRIEYYNKRTSEAETKIIQSFFVLNTGVFAAVVGRSTAGPLTPDFLPSLGQPKDEKMFAFKDELSRNSR